MDAFDPIAIEYNRSRNGLQGEHLMFSNASDMPYRKCRACREMAQIVTIGPIIKNMTESSVEEAKRTHVHAGTEERDFLRDAMGVLGSQLIPWHCYMGFFMGISASVYPHGNITAGDIITHNYLAWIAVGSMLFLTFLVRTDSYLYLRSLQNPMFI